MAVTSPIGVPLAPSWAADRVLSRAPHALPPMSIVPPTAWPVSSGGTSCPLQAPRARAVPSIRRAPPSPQLRQRPCNRKFLSFQRPACRLPGDQRRRDGRERALDGHPAALHPQPPLGEQLDGERVYLVFHAEDAGAQRLLVVVGADRHGPLHDDRAMVGLLVDEVDGGARDLDPVL